MFTLPSLERIELTIQLRESFVILSIVCMISLVHQPLLFLSQLRDQLIIILRLDIGQIVIICQPLSHRIDYALKVVFGLISSHFVFISLLELPHSVFGFGKLLSGKSLGAEVLFLDSG